MEEWFVILPPASHAAALAVVLPKARTTMLRVALPSPGMNEDS